MAPNPQNVRDLTENPVRDAAIHFGAYLQLQNALAEHPSERGVGVIKTDKIKELFTNHYQPQFHTCLVQPKLLSTLMQYHVVRKRNKNEKSNQVVRVVLHPNPSQVRAPTSLSRARVYVDQTGVFRDKFRRPEVVNETVCRLCNISFINEESKEMHIDTDEHKCRLLYREKRSSFKSVVGASIHIADRDIDDNELILRCGERRDIKINVDLGDRSYTEADIIKIFETFDLGDVSATPLQFRNDVPIEVNVSAMFEYPGAYLYPLVAKVDNLRLLKDLIFRVESELMDELAPVTPYTNPKQDIIREMEGPILPGEFLEKKEFNLVIKTPLREYAVPYYYNKFLIHKLEKYDNMNERDEESLNKMLSLLCGLLSYKEALVKVAQSNAPYIGPLDCDTYSDRFALLVHLEELQQQRQIKNYDRTNEVLRRCNTKFFLEVPDLSEGRPSVSKGDKVHIQFHQRNNNVSTVIYEAIIHELQGEGLLLGLHREFSEEYNKLEALSIQPRVDVRFTVNRFPYQNMHRALSLIHNHRAQSIVFPEMKRTPTKKPAKQLALRPWINPLIATNPEQQTAVRNIVQRSSGTAPYLVFGPPGTGKTVTLVEAITQVWYLTQGQAVRQLVCAPSNAACNNIASRLIRVLPPTKKILRLYSMSVDDQAIPDDLIPYSNYNRSKKYLIMPTIDEILANHIIIVTLISAGRIVTGGGGGRFQYVYIDECGQACEPEALIAIAGVLTTPKNPSEGQLVLAGDPQQLGPILSSQPAKDFGLGMSLLERLMNHNSLYTRHEGSGYDNNYLTKLVQNFRSHESILHTSNRLFYHNELEVKGNPAIINCALGWSELPNPNFPLIFHGVQGMDERESNSPSYFNRQEIDLVLTYIKKLLSNGLPNNYKVKEEDIGVITPYRKQVQKFRKAFDLKGWDIRVGSVEEFQGSEKLIIFISTVRSSIELVDEDYFFKLGFLKNPKRFNVSVTRAKALLVVVGNPRILCHDKQWYSLIQYCRDNRAYRGNVRFPEGAPFQHALEHISS